MLIDRIVLHNFGIYRGEHAIDLSTSVDRPIVLFGALNGSGKTTLMEAMQLALYGRQAKTTARGRLPYAEYLERSINRYVPSNTGAGLELDFRHRTDGHDERIHLVRTWHMAGKAVRENFEVWRNGTLDPVAAERWVEFAEDLIPGQISDLFFFDGERIEALADPSRSRELLRVGLHSLLGLDLVDRLIKDLGQVERRRQEASLDAPDRSVVATMQAELTALEGRRADVLQQKAASQVELDGIEREIANLETRFATAGGGVFEARQQLMERQRTLILRRDELTNGMVAIASSDAPLLLVSDLIEEAREAAKLTAETTTRQVLGNLIGERNQLLLAALKREKLPQKHIKTIEGILDAQVKEFHEGHHDQANPVLTASEVPTREALVETEGNLVAARNEFDQVIGLLEDVERSLAAVPSEDDVRDIIVALERAKLKREQLSTRLSLLREEDGQIGREIDRKRGALQRRLETIVERDFAAKTSERVLKHSARARETFGSFRDEIARRHMARLEKLITDCFALLHRKKSLEHRVSIDRKSYELRLLEANGKEVPADCLSAGERQLLAVSVLWALAKASGRRLPTMIDTPLGRLDGPHRHYLVSNYFPNASHQVILFSTDEEIDQRYYNKLRHSVGREYRIVYDEASRSSSVVPGYFEAQEVAA